MYLSSKMGELKRANAAYVVVLRNYSGMTQKQLNLDRLTYISLDKITTNAITVMFFSH